MRTFTAADKREVQEFMRLTHDIGEEIYDSVRGSEPYRINKRTVYEIYAWEADDYNDEFRPDKEGDYTVDIRVRNPGKYEPEYSLQSTSRDGVLERYNPRLKEYKDRIRAIEAEQIRLSKMVYDENWALQEAIKFANKSNCKSKRGVVIFDRKLGLISSGYNRPPVPLICDGSEECRKNCAKTAVHAEQLALLRGGDILETRFEELEMLHVKAVDGEAVHSLQPSCWQCSKLILEAGIKSMWLYQKEGLVEYSALDFHKETLKNCNI